MFLALKLLTPNFIKQLLEMLFKWVKSGSRNKTKPVPSLTYKNT